MLISIISKKITRSNLLPFAFFFFDQGFVITNLDGIKVFEDAILCHLETQAGTQAESHTPTRIGR